MEQTQPQRIAYFDVLRILATFAVIVLHLSAQHWADTDVYSRAWQAFNLYDSAVRWAVPVFVMISGSLFLSGSQSIGPILKKNVSRRVFCTFSKRMFSVLSQRLSSGRRSTPSSW